MFRLLQIHGVNGDESTQILLEGALRRALFITTDTVDGIQRYSAAVPVSGSHSTEQTTVCLEAL